MRRRHVLFLIPALLAACAAPGGPVIMPPNTTLLVVRHGDRVDENLNAKGHARAAALVDAVAGFPLAGIYSPGIQRNLDTAAPLARARALPVTRLPQEAPTAPLMRHGGGQAMIWIGNKGNIATIWKDLSLPDPAPLNYGDLAIVRADAQGRITVEHRRFGPS